MADRVAPEDCNTVQFPQSSTVINYGEVMRYFIFFLGFKNKRGDTCSSDVTCSGDKMPSRESLIKKSLDARPDLGCFFKMENVSVKGFQEISKEDYDCWNRKDSDQ